MPASAPPLATAIVELAQAAGAEDRVRHRGQREQIARVEERCRCRCEDARNDEHQQPSDGLKPGLVAAKRMHECRGKQHLQCVRNGNYGGNTYEHRLGRIAHYEMSGKIGGCQEEEQGRPSRRPVSEQGCQRNGVGKP